MTLSYDTGEQLHAPALLCDEVVSAIPGAVWQGRLDPGLARQAIAIAEAAPLTVHPAESLDPDLAIAGALAAAAPATPFTLRSATTWRAAS